WRGMPRVDLACWRLGRRAPLDGDEAGLAVGVVEAAALERPRRARVVQGRAGPEDPAGGLDLVVGDAVVVGHPAVGGAPQRAQDLGGAPDRELVAGPQPPGQLAHDLPVGAGLPGWLHRLVVL